MSECYLVVNVDQRQYLSAAALRESAKRGGFLRGLHGRALALLVCRADALRLDYGPLAGSWHGHRIVAADDHHPTAVAVGDAVIADLHETARREFEDISLAALAMLCRGDPEIVQQLVDAAAEDAPGAIALAGDVVFLASSTPLQDELDRRLGKAWVARYRRLR
jgi:hypothetical protein